MRTVEHCNSERTLNVTLLLARFPRHREHVVCSVDPPGCQDIDDALSCRVIDEKEGIWEVGVHIADVGHYVKTGSKTDEEAARRR